MRLRCKALYRRARRFWPTRKYELIDNNNMDDDPDDDAVTDENHHHHQRQLSISCCNPRSRIHRYTFLALLCFLSCANDYCGDIPSALQDHIQHDLNINTTNYSLLNSIGAWPNIILCLVGGYVVDRWLGVRLGAILFSSIIFCGQLVGTVGAFYHSFRIMLIGRFIFGLGSDNLAICQEIYCVRWFMARGEFNSAFAMVMTVTRIGSSVSLWVNPPLYKAVSENPNIPKDSTLGYAVAVGLVSCLVSMSVAAVLAALDKRAERIRNCSLLHSPTRRRSAAGESTVLYSSSSSDEQQPTVTKTEVVQFKSLFRLPIALWLLCFVCVGFYCSISPFIGQANLFFQTKYGLDSHAANQCTSIIYFLAAGLSPFAGFVVDRTGRNLSWVILACILGIAVLLLLTFTFISPFLLMVCYGVALTIFASGFWSGIAYTVPHNLLATAYGLVTSNLNLGFTLFNMLAGRLVDSRGYTAMMLLFVACMCASLLFAVISAFVDARKGDAINSSARDRRAATLAAAQEQQAKPVIVVVSADTNGNRDDDDRESGYAYSRSASPNFGFEAHEE